MATLLNNDIDDDIPILLSLYFYRLFYPCFILLACIRERERARASERARARKNERKKERKKGRKEERKT